MNYYLTVIISIVVTVSTALITVSYRSGYYVNKIEHLDNNVSKNIDNISDLQKSVYFLLGKLNIEGVNVDSYLKISTEKKLSFQETITGLSKISDFGQSTGKSYLMQHQGFTEKEVSSVFQDLR